MRKIKNIIICIVVFTLQQGCKDSEVSTSEMNFNQLTTPFSRLEETNRLEFLRIVKSQLRQDTVNSVNKNILDIYYTLDATNRDLLIESGGYSIETGELLGGARKDLGANIFLRKNTITTVKQRVLLLKNIISEGNIDRGKVMIKDIESALYLITSDYWAPQSLKNYTIAALKLDLMIMQYKLLVILLEYSERSKKLSE